MYLLPMYLSCVTYNGTKATTTTSILPIEMAASAVGTGVSPAVGLGWATQWGRNEAKRIRKHGRQRQQHHMSLLINSIMMTFLKAMRWSPLGRVLREVGWQSQRTDSSFLISLLKHKQWSWTVVGARAKWWFPPPQYGSRHIKTPYLFKPSK